MAALGRWMCPHEYLREARKREAVPELSVADEATCICFIEKVLLTPEGERVFLFSDRLRVTRLCVQIGKLLGLTVEVIGEEVPCELAG